jgi:hypothetical protein
MYDRWRIANRDRDIDDVPMASQIDRLSAAAYGLHDATSSAGAVLSLGVLTLRSVNGGGLNGSTQHRNL